MQAIDQARSDGAPTAQPGAGVAAAGGRAVEPGAGVAAAGGRAVEPGAGVAAAAGGAVEFGAGVATAPALTPVDPAVSSLGNDLYAVVVYLHKNCNSDLFAAVGELELTLTQIKLLHNLDDEPEAVSLKRAAESVHVSLPAASRTVDDLVRRGFARREEDAEDRRMKRVSVTDAGRAVIRRLNAARLTGLQQFVDDLTDTERDALAGALEQLLARPDVAACRLESQT